MQAIQPITYFQSRDSAGRIVGLSSLVCFDWEGAMGHRRCKCYAPMFWFPLETPSLVLLAHQNQNKAAKQSHLPLSHIASRHPHCSIVALPAPTTTLQSRFDTHCRLQNSLLFPLHVFFGVLLCCRLDNQHTSSKSRNPHFGIEALPAALCTEHIGQLCASPRAQHSIALCTLPLQSNLVQS